MNNVVTGKGGISPEMAIQLDKAFGGTPVAWLALQSSDDLAQAEKKSADIAVKR